MGRDKSAGPLNALLGRYVGGADLYGAFIERSLRAGNFNGFIGILSFANHPWQRVHYLREPFLRSYCIHSIVNLSNKTFEALSNPNAFYFMSVFINVPPTSSHIYVVDLVGTEYEEKPVLLQSPVLSPDRPCGQTIHATARQFLYHPGCPNSISFTGMGPLGVLAKTVRFWRGRGAAGT